MTNVEASDTVGSIVAKRPALARIFEEFKIDYCCGGKVPLDEACRAKGLEPQIVVDALTKYESEACAENPIDAASMSLTELADHIEQTHHAYLRIELPRLDAMTKKVALVHGAHEPRLHDIRAVYEALLEEVVSHMMKEERILFPMIRQLEASKTTPAFHCGSISNPIHQMEHEHDQVGAAFVKLNSLSDNFTPPSWACNTYRAMLDGLSQMEMDFHQHIHKENNVLFPRAECLAREKK